MLNEILKGVNLTPQQAIYVAAAVSLLNGAALAKLLFNIARVGELREKQTEFLHDIVSRNIEHLEEFDIIALRELGLIRDVTDAA